MEEILETIDIEDESASNVASTTSASSDSSSSSSQHEEPSAKAQPANVDGSTHVLAQLRQTIHVVATWNAPSGTNKATRMACGRQFLTSSLKMVQYADLEAQTGSLCMQPSWLPPHLVALLTTSHQSCFGYEKETAGQLVSITQSQFVHLSKLLSAGTVIISYLFSHCTYFRYILI